MTPANPAALELQLHLERPDFSLDVQAELPAQGVTVLFGPSGSGKTTLLRCVAGLEQARGRVRIGQMLWQDSEQKIEIPTWKRDLGYVFQEASLFEHMTVQANLNYGVKRVRKSGSRQALESAIELLGIGHLLTRKPHSLSGGERQRVAIARALATQPGLLLLDEPLASLDIARRKEILPWLERLHRQLHIPVLYVTHAMDELTRLADHVVLMNNGQATLSGQVAQVLSDPRFAMTMGGEAGAVLDGTVAGHDTSFHLTQIRIHETLFQVRQCTLPPGSAVRLHIHANDVSLALTEPFDSSIQNRLQGTIEGIHDDMHPASCLVAVRHHDQHVLARVTRKAIAELQLQPGKSVWAQIKAVALAGY